MITDTQSILPNKQKHQPQSAPSWRVKLHARGLTDAAIDRAGLRPDGQGWRYPIAPGVAAQRWKAYPGQKGAKYRWLPAKPEGTRFYDPRGDLAGHIAAADGNLILAEGEPDVWACWSAGVFNVTCTMHGAGAIPAWLVGELRRLSVRRVLTWPDRDDAGLSGAAKLRDTLAASGVTFQAHELPYPVGSKADIGTLLLEVGPAQLVAALEACPALDLPTAPRVTPLSADRTYSPPPGEGSDLYERWCLEVEAEAVRAWNIAPPNAKNLSRKNFSSPYREDKRPSAQWSYTAHGFKDYATDEFTSTKRVADLLGLPSWEDYKRKHLPAPRPSAAPAADDAIHYPKPWPVTTTRTLLTAKRRTVDHEDLAGWHVIDQVHSACRMPARVTVAEYVRLANEGGWPVDRRLVSAWLAWGSEQGMYKNLPIAEDHRSNRLKNVHRYEFLPLRQRLDALGVYLAPRVTAPQRAPAKAGEIAAVLGQSAEGLDAIDAARSETLAEAAQERAQHERRAAHWLAYWRSNVERILSGNYVAHELAPQPMSAPRLRQALAAQMIAENAEVTQIVNLTGLSRPKVLDLAREAGYESVPQTETVPSDQVNDAVRARGLVISERDGQATIRRPNVLKPIDKLTEAEKRAASEQRAVQRGLARRRLERPQDALEARWRRQDINRARTAERAAAARLDLRAPEHRRPPRDRLDVWLDHQWELAPPLSPPPIDPETGEVYKGRARWLAAFEIVRGGAVTFAQFSIPRESEAAPEQAPETPTTSPAQEGGNRAQAAPPPRLSATPQAIVTYINGMPYTARMLERRAQRLAEQGGNR